MPNTLYLKYRPQKFSELVAQDHISKVLSSQVKLKDFSHAYIFSGPRGCGKTSTARIFAKAINCLNNIEGEACDSCKNCVQVNENKAIDIIEIDAASNRSIDDIRSFRELVKFHPLNFPCKIFIIDEVHMLTKEAFNALLKTLEEPPEYVLFILCTTDLHKVPITILSRCQQFHFKLATTEELKTKLANICNAENLQIETDALNILIESAQGSFRDAESLLQKLLSNNNAKSDSKITYKETLDILGVADKLKVKKYFEEFANNSFERNIQILNEILGQFSQEQFISVAIKIFREDFEVLEIDKRFKVYELLLELKSKIKSSQNSNDWIEVYLWKIYKFLNSEEGLGILSSTKQSRNNNNYDSYSQTSQLDANAVVSEVSSNVKVDKQNEILENSENQVKQLEKNDQDFEIIDKKEEQDINASDLLNDLSQLLKEEDVRISGYLQSANILKIEKEKIHLLVRSKLAKSVLEIKRNSDKITKALEQITKKTFKLEIQVDEKQKSEEVNPIEIFGTVIA